MLSLTVLGSGSSGNCAVIRTGRTRLLIDAGLSGRQIMLRLEAVGLRLEDLDGVLLTHEHCDHTAGLEILCRRHQVPLFATALTQEALLQGTFRKATPRWRLMQTGSPFDFQDLRIECFPVPHDAADPVGFVISDEDSRLGILSDVGFITNLIRDRLRGVHSLFVEANYDGPLLEADTKRPWATKQRISGRHGHLSNEQTAELLQSLAHEDLHHVVLGHLSDDCNHPDVALQKITAVLRQAGAMETKVICAKRSIPLPWMEVARPRPVSVAIASVNSTFISTSPPEAGDRTPPEVSLPLPASKVRGSVPAKRAAHAGLAEQPDFWLDTGLA
jgi:phosphoribosyl 1,2-cyclic phosphodiesterase